MRSRQQGHGRNLKNEWSQHITTQEVFQTHTHTMKPSSQRTRTEEKISTDFILDGQPEKRGVQREIWSCGCVMVSPLTTPTAMCVCCTCSSVVTILDCIIIWRDLNPRLQISITFNNKCFITKQQITKMNSSLKKRIARVSLTFILIIHSKIYPIILVLLATLVHAGSRGRKGAGSFRAATIQLVGLKSKAGKKVKNAKL